MFEIQKEVASGQWSVAGEEERGEGRGESELPPIRRSAFGIVPIIVAIVGFSTEVQAAPSINNVSGTVRPGSTVTVTGASFGTKAQAAPQVWDNFEKGNVGDVVGGKSPVVGQPWGSNGVQTYTNAQNRTNSTRSCLHDFTNAYNSSLDFSNAGQSQYYFSYYTNISLNTPGYYPRNTKPWLVYGSYNGSTPSAYGGWGDPGVGDGGYRSQITDWDGSNNVGIGAVYDYAHSADVVFGKWVRMEVWLKQSTPNVGNGLYSVFLHLDNHIYQSLTMLNQVTRISSDTWRQLQIGSYVSSDGGRARVYTDDVYIDNTPARVELGDAPTWSACTHREIQIPSAWNATSISAVVNQGTFANGSTAYLYVIDSNNTPSAAGYPIIVGSSVPEPGGLALLAGALLSLIAYAWHRRR
jgi:hypothetical protein